MKIIDNNEKKTYSSRLDSYGHNAFDFMFGPTTNGIVTLDRNTITLGAGQRDENDEQVIIKGFMITFIFDYEKYVESGCIDIDQFVTETKDLKELFTHEIQTEGEVSEDRIKRHLVCFYNLLGRGGGGGGDGGPAMDYIRSFYDERPRLDEEIQGIHEEFPNPAINADEDFDRLKGLVRSGFDSLSKKTQTEMERLKGMIRL